MKALISTGKRELEVDLSRPMSIGIRLRNGEQNPVAWYAEYPKMVPVRMGGFIGSVSEGGSVNTNDITFNPHGNGTHTECIGHLTEESHEIDRYMTEFIMPARVLTVDLDILEQNETEYRKKGDRVISSSELESLDLVEDIRALVIRTSPNDESKLDRVYTGSNPPYFEPEFMERIKRAGIEHLLVDLPSVDREVDGGQMLAHRAFWYDKGIPRAHATITEMIYVPDSIVDGDYLLNIMIAPFGNDASPSKPILYPIIR